jgi:hypothetical protein
MAPESSLPSHLLRQYAVNRIKQNTHVTHTAREIASFVTPYKLSTLTSHGACGDWRVIAEPAKCRFKNVDQGSSTVIRRCPPYVRFVANSGLITSNRHHAADHQGSADTHV